MDKNNGQSVKSQMPIRKNIRFLTSFCVKCFIGNRSGLEGKQEIGNLRIYRGKKFENCYNMWKHEI